MAPLSSLPPLPPSLLDNTIGSLLLGVIGSALISGTTLLQAYLYYYRYPHDKMLNKIAVTILWVLDTLHLCSLVHAVYTLLVTDYGNLAALEVIPLSLKLQAAIDVVIILIVHSLYVQRVWILGGYHKGVLGYIVAFVVAGGAGLGFNFLYVIFKSRTFEELEDSAWVVNAGLGTATGINFMIAAALCYYLLKSKGTATGLNSRISRVIQYMIGTGVFTSAVSLAAMLTYILLPHTFIFVSLGFLVTKLYTGSFLAMLNSRNRTRQKTTGASGSPTTSSQSLIITEHGKTTLRSMSCFSVDVAIQSPPKPTFFRVPPYP